MFALPSPELRCPLEAEKGTAKPGDRRAGVPRRAAAVRRRRLHGQAPLLQRKGDIKFIAVQDSWSERASERENVHNEILHDSPKVDCADGSDENACKVDQDPNR